MVLQPLMSVLKGGFSYIVDGVQQLQPPNKYMIQAHKVIEELLVQANHFKEQWMLAQVRESQLHANIENLTKRLKELTDVERPAQSIQSNDPERNETGQVGGASEAAT